MGPTPVYGARAEKPLQKCQFCHEAKTYMSPSGHIIKTNEFHGHCLDIMVILHLALDAADSESVILVQS